MVKVTMEIPPARASQMAQFFKDAGFEDVSWDAPMEKRWGAEAELVQLIYWLKDNAGAGIVGGAAYAAAQSAVRKIRERFPSVEADFEEDAEGSDTE